MRSRSARRSPIVCTSDRVTRCASRPNRRTRSTRILDGAVDVGPPAGPAIVLRIVGVQRRPLDLGDRAAIGGFLVLSPAFNSTYAGRVGRYGSYLRIRTDAGARGVAPVIAASRRIFGKPLFSAQALNIETKGAGDAIDVLALALWIFAAATAFGGVVAIAIVLSRELDELRDQQDVLTALGLTRTQRIAVGGASAVPVAIGGALLAVLGAIAASPSFPFGVARRADPDVGTHVDLIVTVFGVLAVVGVVTAIAVVAAVRSTRQTSVDAAPRPDHPPRSTVAQVAAERGLAPSVVNGVRMAFQRGGGRTSVPVRSALVGAVVGVLGITAVLVFSASLQQLVATPPRLRVDLGLPDSGHDVQRAVRKQRPTGWPTNPACALSPSSASRTCRSTATPSAGLSFRTSPAAASVRACSRARAAGSARGRARDVDDARAREGHRRHDPRAST